MYNTKYIIYQTIYLEILLIKASDGKMTNIKQIWLSQQTKKYEYEYL